MIASRQLQALAWALLVCLVASGSALAQVLPLANVKAMALGDDHTCALTEAGAVKCWGSNALGQLGDGSGVSSAVPRDVLGLDSGVRSLAAGYAHTCAVTATKRIRCWGDNQAGALGDGSIVQSGRPVEVMNIDDAAAVFAGGITTCALRENGAVMCWGWNASGDLGIGRVDFDPHPLPEPVLGLPRPVVALAKGESHTCALDAGAAVYCWGWNWYGQLGDDSRETRALPTRMKNVPAGVIAVSAGRHHSCVIDAAGTVHCWGDGSQRGDAGANPSLGPVVLTDLGAGIKKVAAAHLHSCALGESGLLRCWGLNDAGQLGDGSIESRGRPVPSTFSGGVRDVITGYHHTCAILLNGNASCWGDNTLDQLGNRTATLRAGLYPKAVSGLESGVTGVDNNRHHACAVAGASAYCWGYNEHGQLGGNIGRHEARPVKVPGLEGTVAAVATGGYHACALTLAGGLACWGRNIVGELGDGTIFSRDGPVAVRNLSGRVVSLALGGSHGCAVISSGAVQCWGYNGSGAVGDGTGVDRYLPTTVGALGTKARSVAAGSGHSCAVTELGAVYCWGGNFSGQLGTGNRLDQLAPTAVAGLSAGIIQVAAGDFHTCALDDRGALWCWGGNQAGQLGMTGSEALNPTKVPGLDEKVQSLSAGATHTCVVLQSGQARCWGGYGGAQVGALGVSTRPVAVPGLPKVTAISAGGSHSCAIDESGKLLCWGGNPWGELGRGLFSYRTSAEPVALAVPAPVSEYHNLALNHYFVTAGEGEMAMIEAGAAGVGWQMTGLGFKAYLPETGIGPGALPVCRFYGTPGLGPNSHFYTVDPIECELVKRDRGWSYEGTAFYVFPPANDQCAAGQQPVYRAYNMRFAQNDSSHRYTTDSATYAQMLAQGWAGEGAKLCGAP